MITINTRSFVKISLILLALTINISAFAQKGTIRGTVFEASTGEPLYGATVVIKGTTTGTTTDFDGKFEISVPPGTYEIQTTFITYRTINISDVVVKQGETTILPNISMDEEVEELGEIVVTADALKTTESALLTIKKKSANLVDGISNESFRKIGVSDAASAVTRVPGVSVQGGKYVFVRGLGDRYTKTTLNSMEVPGLDPDRNTIQLDLFPTSILNNIVVFKSFTADLTADFTGGIVDIEPSAFPEEKSIKVSLSLGFNPEMHFNNNYLVQESSVTDPLGFDSGLRDLPYSSREETPQPVGDQPRLTLLTSKFDRDFGARKGTSLPNINFGFSAGNQVVKGGSTIGYNASISYLNTTTFFEGLSLNNIYQKDSDQSNVNYELDRRQEGSEGNNNVILSGLAGVAVKRDKSKYTLSALRIQNGESTAGIYEQRNFLETNNVSIRHAVGYTERSISNLLLEAENHLGAGWSINTKVAPTFSKISDKDVRLVPFTVSEGGQMQIEPSEGGNPQRLWRFLDEVNYAGKVDATKEFNIKGRASKLKFGGSYIFKERNYSIENFNFLIARASQVELNGDPEEILNPENIYDDGVGTYVRASYQGSNTFESSMEILGAYVSGELALTEKLKSIIGIRGEQFTQHYTGGDQDYFASDGAKGTFLDDKKVLSSFKPFPTVNLIYALRSQTNLRLSYAKTIARPSFKEKSIAQIIDPISATTWIGNIDLVETDINNFDLRWETFGEAGQTIAVSAFYKTFKNPIEVMVYTSAAPDNFTARNNGEAEVLGFEFEARKNLAFISPLVRNFSLNLNTSLIESRLRINDIEYQDRINNRRADEQVERYRDMQGQSPYLVNLSLNYETSDANWEGGLFYNVQGPALAIVGAGDVPDVYSRPFNSLNTTLKRNFGVENKASLSFRVANLLDDKLETVFSSYGAQDQIQTSRSLGRTFTVAFGYSF